MTKDNPNDSVTEEETKKKLSFASEEMSVTKPIASTEPLQRKQEPKQEKKEEAHNTICQIDTDSSESGRRQRVAATTREDDKEDYRLALAEPTPCPSPPESRRFVDKSRDRRQPIPANQENGKEDYQLALAEPTPCPSPPESRRFVEPITATKEGDTAKPGAFRERGIGWNPMINDDEETTYPHLEPSNDAIGDQSPIDASLVPDDPTLYEGQQLSESWLRRNKLRVIVGIAFLLLAFIVAIVTIVITLNLDAQDIVVTNSLEIFGRPFDRATESIDLYNNGLEGSIPSKISSLTELTSLSLSNNALTGTIPAQFGSLAKLRNLSSYYNKLTGTIPAQYGSLTKLTYLSLGHNMLNGTIPSQLGSLTQLKKLYLYGNALTGAIPTELELLSELRRLDLYENDALHGSFPASFCAKDPRPTIYFDSGQNITCNCCEIPYWI